MPLPTPPLDTRTFKDLVAEARARIPRYTPEWTNFNDADPGVALVKLQAWLTETLLYQVNQLPDLNYLKFLDLLQVKPLPARAAVTELTFTLKKLRNPEDPLRVFIPRFSQIGVDDPDLPEPLVFETDYTLAALNAAIGAVLIPNPAGAGAPHPYRLITRYTEKDASTQFAHAFYPFGEPPAADAQCLIGIVPRPYRDPKKDYTLDSFPAGQLDLTVFATNVFDADDHGNRIAGPFGTRCEQDTAAHDTGLVWEAYTAPLPVNLLEGRPDAAWKALDVQDESAGLLRSGHLRLELPEGLPTLSLYQLPRAVWQDLGLHKPPTTLDELKADLQDPALTLSADLISADDWQSMGVPDTELAGLTGCCEAVVDILSRLDSIQAALSAAGLPGLAVHKVPASTWQELDAGYDTPEVPGYGMIWLRARLTGVPERFGLLNALALNTVPATAAVTRQAERLGFSNGRPAQVFNLARKPVYVLPDSGEPDLQLEVIESGVRQRWTRVEDFYRTDASSDVFVLDPVLGTLTFGDGRHGRIPIAGAELLVSQYRHGGGALGNVGPNTVTKLKSALPNVDKVSNPVAAANGRDAEPLDDTRLRAAHTLRHRDRAVTAEDFAQLACETPGVAIQRAYALGRTRLDVEQQLEGNADGAVTVVILPVMDHPTPQPSEAQLRAVCRHLDARRLLTTELYVTGPRYLTLARVEATLSASPDVELKTLHEQARQRLLDYAHPLRGGPQAQGWPFGEDLYYGALYQQLLSLPGVRRVTGLFIQTELEAEDEALCRDRIEIPDGFLLHLPADALHLQVRHER